MFSGEFCEISKSIFLTEHLWAIASALYDCVKLIYVSLNEGDQVRECYSCLKLREQAHLHVGFFKAFFVKHVSLILLIYKTCNQAQFFN